MKSILLITAFIFANVTHAQLPTLLDGVDHFEVVADSKLHEYRALGIPGGWERIEGSVFSYMQADPDPWSTWGPEIIPTYPTDYGLYMNPPPLPFDWEMPPGYSQHHRDVVPLPYSPNAPTAPQVPLAPSVSTWL